MVMSEVFLQGICPWFDEKGVQHKLF